MKITKKITLLSSFLILGITFFKCGSSDDFSSDTTENQKKETPNVVSETPIQDLEQEETPVTNEPETVIYEQEVKADGTIVIQAESAQLVGDWKERTAITGFNGGGYIVWEGPEKFWGKGSPGKNGLLTYSVDITQAGTYQFVWTSRIIKVAPEKPNTEHNDSWIRIPDADDFYAFDPKNMDKYYPQGNASNKTPVIPIDLLNPNPNNLPKGGENGNGFFKGYMNTNDRWLQETKTWDNNPMFIYAAFNNPGTYTVEIDARSDGHGIDQFSLIPQ